MKNEWDEYAQEWDTNPEVQAYAEQAFQQLTQHCQIAGKTILDFGCGTGSLTALLAKHANKVVALDNAKEMIAQLDSKGFNNVVTINEELTDSLIQTHNQLAKPFDMIVASSVCGFLPNYPATLILLKSLLKEGGTFIQWDWLADNSAATTASIGFSREEVTQALTQCQFSHIQLSTPFQMNNPKGLMTVLMAIANK